MGREILLLMDQHNLYTQHNYYSNQSNIELFSQNLDLACNINTTHTTQHAALNALSYRSALFIAYTFLT